MKHLCLALGLTAFLVGSSARAENTQRTASYGEATYLLETWIESILDFDRLPGMSVAVIHDQEIAYANGFGYADLDERKPATPETIYSICSISKLFTGVAVMQLRDAGKLDLEDPVSKHLPWLEPETPDPEAAPPTLRDLLRHSGGLPCESDHTVWADSDQLFPTREQLIERVSKLKLSYSPNTNYNYSNLGYALLGLVVSAVSGMEYVDYVHENVIAPLGMDATTPFIPRDTGDGSLAVGYGRWPRSGSRDEVVNYEERSFTPAAGFYSTVRDMAKFAMWQFRVLDGKDDRILGKETLEEMYAVAWENPQWGLGFAIWQMDDKRFVGHWGGCPGYKSQFILCPEEKVAAVVMVNATDAPQFTLVFRTYEIIAPVLTAAGSRALGSSEWARYVGYYTGDKTWSEAEVLEWEGALAVMWIPNGNPNPVGSLVKLERVEGEVFRQLNGDETLGKHYVFKADDDGDIVRMKFNNNLLDKMPSR